MNSFCVILGSVGEKMRMYEGVKTWNPIVGCNFLCLYCDPSFQKQMRRQKQRCFDCYTYTPHFHPERLNKLPNAKTIFTCAFSDIACAEEEWIEKVLDVVRNNQSRIFYIQTKDPAIFDKFDFPNNVLKGVTIETDLDRFETPSLFVDYTDLSRAPTPSKRIKALSYVDYITIEPILDFSQDFASVIREIKPKFVYIGYDNHNTNLPEPELQKTRNLLDELGKFVEVRVKTLRRAWYELVLCSLRE